MCHLFASLRGRGVIDGGLTSTAIAGRPPRDPLTKLSGISGPRYVSALSAQHATLGSADDSTTGAAWRCCFMLDGGRCNLDGGWVGSASALSLSKELCPQLSTTTQGTPAIATIMASSTSVVEAGCREDWTEGPTGVGGCYRQILPKLGATQPQCEALCNQHNATLVCISSQEEDAFLRSAFPVQQSCCNSAVPPFDTSCCLYIGLYQGGPHVDTINASSHLHWEAWTATDCASGYRAWTDGEPNDFNNFDENCAHIDSNGGVGHLCPRPPIARACTPRRAHLHSPTHAWDTTTYTPPPPA